MPVNHYLWLLKIWSRCFSVERFSIECHKTETIVSTSTNQIREKSKRTNERAMLAHVTGVKRGKMWVTQWRLVIVLHLIDWGDNASFLAVLIESSLQGFFLELFNTVLREGCVLKLSPLCLSYLKEFAKELQRREYIRLQKLKRERQLQRAQSVPAESSSGSTGELQVSCSPSGI